MKKTLLITGVLLALTASAASAAGINLYWNDCGQGATQTNHKTFACNTNAGTNNDMYMSFEPDQNLPAVTGNNHFLDLQSATDPLPQWWQFKNAGTCRAASLIALSAITGSCFDTWQGQASPGVAAYLVTANTPAMATNRARIIGSVAVPGAFAASVDPGTEYFSMILRINNAKTVGVGACGGCLDAVCVVLNDILVAQPPGQPGGSPSYNSPISNNWVTWQGQLPGTPCPGATPTTNRTWGQLKSIYR